MKFFYIVLLLLIPSLLWGNLDKSISSIKKSYKPSIALEQLNVLKNNDYKNDKIATFAINIAIADCYTDLGMYHTSISLLKNNLENIKNLNFKNFVLIANTHLSLANNYDQIFMFNKYLDHINKYYEAIDKAHPNQPIYKAFYYASLSRYYNIKYEVDKAKYYSLNALNIYHKNKKKSNLIEVHKLYAAHLFTLRNVDEKTYVNKFKYLDTLNYFLEKEIPQNSTKKAKVLVSNAALDFDIAYNSFHGVNNGDPKFHMKRAISLYDKALKMHEDLVGPNHNISARIHGFKSYLYYASGDYSTAINECDKGIKKITESALLSYGFSNNNYFLISLLKTKNTILNKINPDGDRYVLEQKIKDLESLEKIWNRYFQDQIHISNDYMSNMYNESPYSLLFDAYLKLYEITKNPKHLEKIHEYDEKSKYKGLLNTVFLNSNEKKEKELLYQKRQVIYQLYDLYNFLKNKKKENIKPEYANLKKLIVDYDSIERNTQLFRKYEITSLKHLQKQLSSKEAIVSFFRNELSDKILYAKIILKNDVYLVDVFKDKKIFDDLVSVSQKDVLVSLKNQDIESFKKHSHKFYKIVFEKIDKLLPHEITHLELIPNAELSNFPFEMLLFKNTSTNDWRKLPYLINKYHFNQVLSSSITNLNSKPSKERNNLVFLLPSFKSEELQELHISKAKAKEFEEKYDALLLHDKLATKKSFSEYLKTNSVISVFSHGQSFVDFDDSKKGIYFSDGFLSLEDIYKLESNSDFLILGACETGLGGRDNGEGNINLARAFTSIGVKSMLLAFWKIDEESTLEITSSFFDFLKQGLSKSEALQKAKLEYIKKTNPRNASPFYWAGLQIVGSNENLSLKGDDYDKKYWFLLILLVIGMGYYIRKKRR